MKIVRIAFAVVILCCVSNANALADPDTPTNPIAHLTQVVALDANRDSQITAKGVHNGYDTFIAREITEGDTNTKNLFTARDGKTYIAVSFAELRSLDKNKNGILESEELQQAKSPLITARMLEDSDQIIVERPLSMSIKSITLPAKDQITGTGTGWDNNHILIQQVNL